MLTRLKNINPFAKNVILVFVGSSLANFLNLVCQLLVAHKFSPQEFAAFNSLYSLFMIIGHPLGSMQLVVAKYLAEFNARKDSSKISLFLSYVFNKSVAFSLVTFALFLSLSFFIMRELKIDSASSGYVLAVLFGISWLIPVVKGGLQGLELFGWLFSFYLLGGIANLVFIVLSIALGFQIAGALGALAISIFSGIIIGITPLRKFFATVKPKGKINYKEIILYIWPTLVSNICFALLIRFDMVLVRYYLSPEDSGVYSLASMVGKIFLLLPGAISIVMFPRVSGLHALKAETAMLLKKVLIYSLILCAMAFVFYNCFPGLVLKILTGKAYQQAANLGRVFGVSMTVFSLLFVFINYFLSVHDFRFIKYLCFSVILQYGLIGILHRNVYQVQYIMLFNSIVLFVIFYGLAFRRSNKAFPNEASEEAGLEYIP